MALIHHKPQRQGVFFRRICGRSAKKEKNLKSFNAILFYKALWVQLETVTTKEDLVNNSEPAVSLTVGQQANWPNLSIILPT